MKKHINKSRGLSGLSTKWKNNWPVIAGGMVALSASAIAAGPAIFNLASGSGFQFEASNTTSLAFGILAGLTGGNMINNGIRIGNNELATDELTRKIEKNILLVKQLLQKVSELETEVHHNLTPNNIDHMNDGLSEWASFSGCIDFPIQIADLTLRRECLIRENENAHHLEYQIEEAGLLNWVKRISQSSVSIYLSNGTLTVEDQNTNAFTTFRQKRDPKKIIKLAVFLRELKEKYDVDLGKIKIFFSERDSPSKRSIFIGQIHQSNGKSRQAVLVYGNGLDMEKNHGDRGVFIDYRKTKISAAKQAISLLGEESTEWTAEQLIFETAQFHPDRTTMIGPLIPDEYVFNYRNPPVLWEIIDTGDAHFSIRESPKVYKKYPNKVFPNLKR